MPEHGRPWPHPRRPLGPCVNAHGLPNGRTDETATLEERLAGIVLRHWSRVPGYESEAGCLTALAYVRATH